MLLNNDGYKTVLKKDISDCYSVLNPIFKTVSEMENELRIRYTELQRRAKVIQSAKAEYGLSFTDIKAGYNSNVLTVEADCINQMLVDIKRIKDTINNASYELDKVGDLIND